MRLICMLQNQRFTRCGEIADLRRQLDFRDWRRRLFLSPPIHSGSNGLAAKELSPLLGNKPI